jgi:hypothetical protein
VLLVDSQRVGLFVPFVTALSVLTSNGVLAPIVPDE